MQSIVNAQQNSRYRIAIVTHAARGSRIGNRVTALRWAKFLRQAGHKLRIVGCDLSAATPSLAADAVIVLHARRCAALQQDCFAHPHHPWQAAAWVVALTGTDIYGGWPNAEETTQAVAQLSGLIALQEDMKIRLPAILQARTQVIYQSATVAAAVPSNAQRPLQILVSGHLRHEKDPFATVTALHHYLADANLIVRHCGGEIEAGYAAQARAWQQQESRYRYLGELSRAQANQELRNCDVLVNASLQEGGPAIVTEAIVAGVPVIASDIPAHRALLGADYPALFAPQDQQQLAAHLLRLQQDPQWMQQLKMILKQRAPLFSPQHEAQQLIQFIAQLIEQRRLTVASKE